LQYVDDFQHHNRHLDVASPCLDFDVYEPEKLPLQKFLPLMAKGAVVAFNELNCENFPDKAVAVSEITGIDKFRLKRFPFEPWISYLAL